MTKNAKHTRKQRDFLIINLGKLVTEIAHNGLCSGATIRRHNIYLL